MLPLGFDYFARTSLKVTSCRIRPFLIRGSGQPERLPSTLNEPLSKTRRGLLNTSRASLRIDASIVRLDCRQSIANSQFLMVNCKFHIRAPNAVFTRSAVNGTWRRRAPVASKIALAIAAATTVTAVSPAPVASSSGRLRSTVSIFRDVCANKQGAIGSPVDRRHLLVVPGHFLAERAAHALQRAALELIPQAIGVRDRAAVIGDHHARHRDFARWLDRHRLRPRSRSTRYRLRTRRTDMPRPDATPTRRAPARGDGRASQFAALAAALTTAMSLGSRRWRSRNATGSAFTCAATSSMNDSCAKVFCRRDGERNGPV